MALTAAQLDNLRPRFEDKVAKGAECDYWLGAVNANGYGSIILAKRPWRKRVLTASRVAYELYNGPIPRGLFVLHKCDNPLCVRPSHLFLGLDADNRRDCMMKGRANGARGARNCKAKLNDRKATLIYVSVLRSTRELAAKYGVSMSTVQRIRRGKLWRHLWR